MQQSACNLAHQSTIGLVGCGARKLGRPAPARDLYTSPLFRKSLAYAERRCQRVYVLSAALGLLELDQEVMPYDRRMGRGSERELWGIRVAGTLIARHGREVDYLVLAGADYARPLATALCCHDGHRDGAWRGVSRDRVLQPLLGLPLGWRLRRLNELLASEEDRGARP
jgi:hypothetical protein